MDLSIKALGQHAVTQLSARLIQPVLVVGSDKFTRGDLSRMECFNFIAAATLNKAIADLGAKNLKDLFTNYPPSALALPRVGTIAMAVIGSAMQVKGIGGEHPLEAWIARHSDRGEEGIRTFNSIKAKLKKDAAEERTALKKSKRQRKARAHELRTQRFLDRAADTPEGTS